MILGAGILMFAGMKEEDALKRWAGVKRVLMEEN
jgi:hypothetical protein